MRLSAPLSTSTATGSPPIREHRSISARFVIATDEFLGVAPSKNYLFIIILSPSGAYYESGLAPVGIWIEDEYVRAVRGGMGFAKTGGNYACSLAAQEKAHEDGYSQVLWLDGVERKYIEEVGAMNIFFKIDGKIVTPMLNGSILPGITRDSVLTWCRSEGIPCEERRISVDELIEAQKSGKLEEVFGSGTAAVISPVGKLRYKNEVFTIAGGGIGEYSQKLYDFITGRSDRKDTRQIRLESEGLTKIKNGTGIQRPVLFFDCFC